MRQIRIRKRDTHNWVIERWMPPSLIPSGPKKGEMSKGKWDDVGFFPQLKHAAARCIDEALADLLPKDGWSGADLSDAIEEAEKRVMDALP